MSVNYTAYNSTLEEENVWDPTNFFVYCGNVMFAGYDRNNMLKEHGACSLSMERIDYCMRVIALYEVDR